MLLLHSQQKPYIYSAVYDCNVSIYHKTRNFVFLCKFIVSSLAECGTILCTEKPEKSCCCCCCVLWGRLPDHRRHSSQFSHCVHRPRTNDSSFTGLRDEKPKKKRHKKPGGEKRFMLREAKIVLCFSHRIYEYKWIYIPPVCGQASRSRVLVEWSFIAVCFCVCWENAFRCLTRALICAANYYFMRAHCWLSLGKFAE